MPTIRSRSVLGPERRAEAWRRLSEESFDIVIVGGGVVGTGSAVDAATRGLSVAVVEARDFAAGTSSRSSKMFHGGLRYLEQLDFGLVAEALHERELSMTRLAPHLVKPLKFLFPLTRRFWERPYMAAGFVLYDLMGGAKSVPPQKHYSRAGARRVAPGLREDVVVGGIRYWDTLVDDARHTLTLARTAALHGAVVANSTQVIGYLREGERVTGVRVRDAETGRETDVRAGVVLNAAGVWTDHLQEMLGEEGGFTVRASKGVHIVVDRDKVDSEAALILRTEKSVLFVIPWGEYWIIGTTDTDWQLDLAHPAATGADIDYILGHVNAVLTTPIGRDDVRGVYAGLRPLLSGGADSTAKLSREHAVMRAAPGAVVVAGGKYTTYRVMAADAVDAAVAELGPERAESVPASTTDRIPLLGADGYPAMVNRADRIADHYEIREEQVQHLLDRYGSLLEDVLDLAADRPDLLETLDGADRYLRVEIVYAALAEAALHLEDVLVRRTRISMEYQHGGVACAREAAQLMAEVLDWDTDRVEREVEMFEQRVAAELASQVTDSDDEADGFLRGVPEVREFLVEATVDPASAEPVVDHPA
ncbi:MULTISPECIES: glycerol-3-phosphate dehydrogenase/oxidase [Dietzia]|uniref:Glycerol-3-phosphate dehydrogenase n=1 Tax=Dietzia cercidiphylli TaxID=498199 RepID=A0ABP4UHD8_9ACTN|nr:MULTISPECIES: glycerol-3-phosphate dehydrogenase/oxidase [Dietzia]MBC7295959.1 glycerol-3-phosphate dehydrogenase/oxidase [Dietzia sp.]MBB1034249.1 glycerol-3-phosphate dehydrogenase/oxidase [Dietzia sp. CQ4]MBB1041385.1 glycerol-3-phosphate dehydrogenase/oxidase [Dietzia sp. Cai40]MBB1044477.1 glycerol-3-phosphate dehydrogenase/oxidase [Dietzia sp. DQ11-44]MBB1047161.1 glycerol-3-phosphate dehydrogenase/oxidase [Dietzia cercidiphylli]